MAKFLGEMPVQLRERQRDGEHVPEPTRAEVVHADPHRDLREALRRWRRPVPPRDSSSLLRSRPACRPTSVRAAATQRSSYWFRHTVDKERHPSLNVDVPGARRPGRIHRSSARTRSTFNRYRRTLTLLSLNTQPS